MYDKKIMFNQCANQIVSTGIINLERNNCIVTCKRKDILVYTFKWDNNSKELFTGKISHQVSIDYMLCHKR